MASGTIDVMPSREAGPPQISTHTPVLLDEVLRFLEPSTGGVYVDATLGGGGYAEALLRASSPAGRLVAMDRDREALERAERRLAPFGSRVHLIWGSFADMDRELDALGLAEVDGIVADLGLSSIQLEDPERGFAFSREGPLDMRFDRSRGETAAELVNRVEERELAELLRDYGEERRARALAKRIVARRPIRTTTELRRAIVSVLGPRRSGKDPAMRTFQALRIAVNHELDALETLLSRAPERLASGGRFAVVAYHSLEDRMVKLAFRSRSKPDEGERYRVLTKKPVVPTAEEIRANPRSRSAKLRVLERVV